MKLTIDMAGILVSLASGDFEADNFKRHALASLASRGLVDIISGIAFLTTSGAAFLPQANKIIAASNISFHGSSN